MRAFLKITLIAVGLTGLLGGALLSMGHLRTAESDLQELEMARLRNLASNWEANLLSVRSSFRDLMLRHNVTAIVEHPSEWAAWRVENKVQQMQDNWPTGLAKPRGWMLLRNNGELHAVVGDSSGISAALDGFSKPDAPDILLGSPEAGRNRFLALQYAPTGGQENPTPGRLVAIVDPQALFVVPDDPPAHWTLMNGPTEAFLASTRGAEPPIGAGTWNILLSEPHGMITMDGGLPLAFCRIHVPGMSPLLVVSEIETPMGAASAAGALLLLTAGTACLVFAMRPRRTSLVTEATSALQGETDENKPTPETVTFRQIFQAVHTPLCVVDANGKLLRVNSAGRELLHLPKGGQPDDSLTVIGSEFQGTLREFFKNAAQPGFQRGNWLLSKSNKHFFDGEILATRLSAAGNESGPVALEFVENKPAERVENTRTIQTASVIDNLNPQPILLADAQGRVIESNSAALEISAKLADKPLLHEVLPGLELVNVANVLDPYQAQRFESLFGSRVHEFYPVPTAKGTLLYGLKKSDAQSLQIALHQAQENFNTLCATITDAVLLVDPRTHLIQEANLAASDLFGAVHPGLPGKNIDEFADWPWQEEHLRASIQLMRADDQCVQCSFEHELIKIEGEPTLLVVVSRLFEYEQHDARGLADYADSVAENISEQIYRSPEPNTPVMMPVGPGMLVVTNPTVRDVARRMLERLGHACEVFTNLDDATIWIVRSEQRPEFVMIDLGDFDQPQDWIEMVRSRCGDVPCVGLTDNDTEDLPDGSNAVLNKPFELEDVVSSLQRLDLDSALES